MQDTHRAHTCSPHVWSDNSTLLTASALDSSRARGVDAVICHQSTPTHHIKRLHSDILSLSLSLSPHPQSRHPPSPPAIPHARTPAPCTPAGSCCPFPARPHRAPHPHRAAAATSKTRLWRARRGTISPKSTSSRPHCRRKTLPALRAGAIAKPVRAELTKRAQRQKFAPLCQSAPQQRVSAGGAERRLGRDRHGPGSSILRAAGCAADLRRLGARRGRVRGGDAPG